MSTTRNETPGSSCPTQWDILGWHVDSIAIRFPRDPGDDPPWILEQPALDRTCGSVSVRPSPGPPGRPARHSRLLVHRPRPGAFETLDALASAPKAQLQEVAVALEVRAKDAVEAQQRAVWIARHLRRPWSRDPWTFVINGHDLGSHYTSRRSWNTDRLVIYPRRSKLYPSQNAVRIERRVAGPEKTRRALRGVVTPSDILALSPGVLFESLGFEMPNLIMLGRQALGRARAKRHDGMVFGHSKGRFYDSDEATGSMIAVRAAIDHKEPWLMGSAQAIRASCREKSWFRPESSMLALRSPLSIEDPKLRFPQASSEREPPHQDGARSFPA